MISKLRNIFIYLKNLNKVIKNLYGFLNNLNDWKGPYKFINYFNFISSSIKNNKKIYHDLVVN